MRADDADDKRMTGAVSGAVTVTVASTRGSVPREAGAFMRITRDGQTGTIGGGALEWEATRIARAMLAEGTGQTERTFPLGPDLGQCCGGSVTLVFERDATAPDAGQQHTQPPLWIWGAGHVGRAIARVIAPLQDREIVLVDVAADRFPEDLPHSVLPLVASDPARVTVRAPAKADHLIVTYSHDLDLALCDALLRHGFYRAGLIGSATKWARFRRRLATMGHADAEISRIACPIGTVGLGKHPQAIAVGVAAALLSGRDTNLGTGWDDGRIAAP